MPVFENEDVVISGVGGFFPKANNIREFQNRLFANEDLLESRWTKGERGVTNKIGKIPNEFFDNAHFGIHRTQCTYMDPMHRTALEATYEALIDAGVNPSEIRGKRVACYMGSSIGENDNLFLESITSGFGITGHSRAMMPNRISYWLDLKGPSIAYDSNWLSGLEVLRLAYEAVKTGDCDAAIAGCANLVLNSEFQWLYNDMGLLSNDGTTRPFDASAQGYGRSDGVVVLYIQPARTARRSYANIIHAATSFDGNHDQKLINVNTENLVDFLEDFYAESSVEPSEVEFVETYGCGLKETDKVEVEALEAVYCKNRKDPLLIGSVKSNTGHGEATSALFSIVKVLIAMETQTIPATIHFTQPNPEILPLVKGTVQVVSENTKWGGKYAAVNFIGLTSCYGHLLLKGNEKKKEILEDDIPRLVFASSRTQDGMTDILQTIRNKSSLDVEYVKILQEVFSKPISGHIYRGYTVLGGVDNKKESGYHLGNKRQIWFVYSGMGSQWCGMLSDLMKIEIFAKAINNCHEILTAKGLNLLEILTSNKKKNFDNILHSFVGIAAVQIALTDVLKALGIVPDGIIGHSVGELGCAYADDCMTAKQMILSAYSRGKASLEATLIPGMMAAVGLGYQKIKNMCPPTIEVACHNGPDSSTISGPTGDMEVFVKDLQEQGIFARLVNVSNIAYHSRYIRPAAQGLLQYLKDVLPEPKLRSAKWISTSNEEDKLDSDLARFSSAEYHTNNLLNSVLFEEGLLQIPKDAVLIEIAPHGLLQAILKRSVKSSCSNITLTQRGTNSGTEFLLSAIGKLFLAGLNMDVSVLFPTISFPVSRGTSSLSELTHWEHSETWRTGLEDKVKAVYGVKDCAITLNSEEFRDSIDHQIDDKITLPFSCYLNIIVDIISVMSTAHNELIFENLVFKRPVTVPKIGSNPLHAMIQKGTGEFEILTGTEIIVTGKLTFPKEKFMINSADVHILENNVKLLESDVYNEFLHRGHKYSGNYKLIENLILTEDGSVATVKWNTWTSLIEAMFQQHLFEDGERNQEIFLPKMINKIMIDLKELPTETTNLTVSYHYDTNLVSTKGLQVFGLKAVKWQKERKLISFDCLEFVKLQNNYLPNIESGINMAIALTLNNFGEQLISNVIVTEVKSQNSSLLNNIRQVLTLHTKINSNLALVQDVSSIVVQSADPFLIIYNDKINADLVDLVASSHVFLLVRTDESLQSFSQIVQISEFIVSDIQYSIIRKNNTPLPIVVNVNHDTMNISDLTKETIPWVNELITSTTVAKSKNLKVFLIASAIPTEGIFNFTTELLSSPRMSPVRVLFIINTQPEAVTSMMKQIFEQDLTLTVVKNGILETILPVPEKLRNDTTVYSSNNSMNNLGRLKNISIKFIGINLKDDSLVINAKKSYEIANYDYSGVTKSGDSIMGIAKLDQNLCKLEIDPIFCWKVPEIWNLEDAATVPNAYLCAYYYLIIKAKLKPSDTVLIHSGCSPIGFAAISIATFIGSRVFTSISNKAQYYFIKNNFFTLSDCQILSNLNCNFEPNLKMATNGVGANVILNNLTGSLLQVSLDCLAQYGRFVQIGRYDLEENISIGLGAFMKSTALRVVSSDNIFNESKEIKQKLRDLVQKGIDSFCVRPMFRKLAQQSNILNSVKSLNQPEHIGKVVVKVEKNLALNKFILHNPVQFSCNGTCLYLLYGGTSDDWINLIEWLIFRGARRIVVCSEIKAANVQIRRRLSLLQSYFEAEVTFACSKGNTPEEAAELLSQLNDLGLIHAVFMLTLNNDSKDIQNFYFLDSTLRILAPKASLVNFINNTAGLCYLRDKDGFSTFNVQWERDLNCSDVILGLDEILSCNMKNVLIKNDKISDTAQETTKALFKKLTLLLPSSLDEFIEAFDQAPTKPELIQLPTSGPRTIRELAPIFVIPGLSGHTEVREMCLEFLYPTYLAVFPATPLSIKELAFHLVKKIKTVWPKGPYNIVGISWGGALTIEIARLLAKDGASLHLYFIDSAPSTLQSALNHLGENNSTMETNLIARILNINDADVVKNMNYASSWDERVVLALNNYNSPIDKSKLADCICTLKSHLQNLKAFQPNDDLVPGQVHLIRPIGSSEYDCCGLLQYCKLIPQITLVVGDHLSIIKNNETSDYINERHYLI